MRAVVFAAGREFAVVVDLVDRAVALLLIHNRRPDIEAMGRVAEALSHHLAGRGRSLDIRTLHECYAPVHFDAAMHQ